MTSMRKLGCVALAAFVLAGCQRASAPASQEPTIDADSVTFPRDSEMSARLVTTTLGRSPAPLARLNGRLTWNEDRTVRVYTPFAGRVVRILVQPGDRVQQGQTLAVLASPDFGQAQADARRAQSDFALSEKNLARVKELEENGVAPRKDLQAAEADRARAGAELERARQRLRLYGSHGDSVDQTFALASPIAGVVVEKNINPGQELRPDQMLSNAPALFVVTDPAYLWVMLEATDRDLSLVRLGQIVTIRSPVYRDEDFTARVDAISDFLDPSTRTIRIRGSMDNSHRKLKAEMFVTAELLGKVPVQMQLPSRAVFFQGEKRFVFVDDGEGKYTRREIRIGDEQQGAVEVRDGLKDGEKVVTEGALMLQQILQPRRVQK